MFLSVTFWHLFALGHGYFKYLYIIIQEESDLKTHIMCYRSSESEEINLEANG